MPKSLKARAIISGAASSSAGGAVSSTETGVASSNEKSAIRETGARLAKAAAFSSSRLITGAALRTVKGSVVEKLPPSLSATLARSV